MMKTALAAMAFTVGASLASAQTAPAPQGGDLTPWPWADRDKIPLVMMIDRVSASIEKSNPPQLILGVKAKVNSGGWSNARIRRVFYPASGATWPTDGFADFYVEATPPSGIVTMGITEIPVPDATFPMGLTQTLKGVKVHEAANCLWMGFDGAKPDNPGRCTQIVDR